MSQGRTQVHKNLDWLGLDSSPESHITPRTPSLCSWQESLLSCRYLGRCSANGRLLVVQTNLFSCGKSNRAIACTPFRALVQKPAGKLWVDFVTQLGANL